MHFEPHLHIWQILFQQGKAFTQGFGMLVHPRVEERSLFGTGCSRQSDGAFSIPRERLWLL